MSGHKYLPILKTKAGERWAIDHTEHARRDHLTPLFEIHQHKSKGFDEHAAEICESLASIWGTSRPLFLDTCWLHEATGNPAVIESVFASSRDVGLHAIPVARLAYDSAALDVLSDAVSEDKYGWLLRLSPSETTSHDAINAVVSHLGVPRSEVDLLLDYRNIPMHLPAHVPQLPMIADWRTFSASSAAFPRSISHLAANTWHELERSDWLSWTMGIAGPLARTPAFGDYTIRDPGPAAEGGQPPVNLRYTTEDSWLVKINGKFNLGQASNMYQICAELVQRPEYRGRAFSDGDAEIDDCAQELGGPGAPQQWLQWGMNHHIAFTIEQLLAL